ncbi:hypothetical protein FGW37_05325 [Streptomyces rectiverticillatus]|uniref:hypothetical protein n=1 Tax=Streptomyces rectiverticillatus TaxID=173860 RepID=UPI0015C38FFE|nr:hypothetical protein [Streptomyces rectiverticillatus]QLE71101.1 hypothetical protein FGW37_05325 [Streptomyces rectiverticillatus]
MSTDDPDVIVTDEHSRGLGTRKRTSKAREKHSWRQQAREELEDLAEMYKLAGELLKGARP